MATESPYRVHYLVQKHGLLAEIDRQQERVLAEHEAAQAANMPQPRIQALLAKGDACTALVDAWLALRRVNYILNLMQMHHGGSSAKY